MSSMKKKGNPLEKKIPVNPKYKDVKPVVDTGASVSKFMRDIEEKQLNYRYRPDEIFKRMKITTFVQLLIQVADITAQDEDDTENIPPSMVKTHESGEAPSRPDTAVADDELQMIHQDSPNSSSTVAEEGDGIAMDTARSTLSSVIQGVGEIDIEQQSGSSPKVIQSIDTCPYLLLDVREEDEFSRCHLIRALSYPSAMLSRSVNYETKEMLSFKNQRGKIIILYDEDERIAHKCATTLVQRGYDNLFLLSGGLKVAYKTFPEGLMTGTVPSSISPLKKGQIANSATKTKFSEDDMTLLRTKHDDVLIASHSGRKSTASSRVGSVSQMSGRTSASGTNSKPVFKP
ncbi:centrosomal protein of 41 kDa-like [Tubulanus polymorphus]|uniref:centrosomal protein of 41 kDa-like n=1 Tax=Tubulanus polymorphus TaxID=672921 RepID=UPI003DA5DCF3